jgi:hypothetical protein
VSLSVQNPEFVQKRAVASSTPGAARLSIDGSAPSHNGLSAGPGAAAAAAAAAGLEQSPSTSAMTTTILGAAGAGAAAGGARHRDRSRDGQAAARRNRQGPHQQHHTLSRLNPRELAAKLSNAGLTTDQIFWDPSESFSFDSAGGGLGGSEALEIRGGLIGTRYCDFVQKACKTQGGAC